MDPHSIQINVHLERLREARRSLDMDPLTPNSREKALALTKLDESIMWLEHAPAKVATRPA